jgi:hypothetical protein
MPSADASSTELHDFQHGKEDVEFSLPLVDRGKDAYLFLAGAFMVELLVLGLFVCNHIAFGIYLTYFLPASPVT